MTHRNKTENRLVLQNKQPILFARQRIMQGIRKYFDEQGYLEVSTPIRIAAPAPELHIDTEPCGDHFLIASPELQMKQLVAAGYPKIYQITKCFRQGERGSRHLPEFTMLEWYETGATLMDLMDHCKGIVKAGAEAVAKYPLLSYGDLRISLNESWPAIEVQDAFERFAGWIPGGTPDPLRFDLDLVEKVEPALPLESPVFLVGYPANMASLARIDPHNSNRALRCELYAGGMELANGFEELTDAKVQRERFEEEENQRRSLGKPPYPMDLDFLDALEMGLPSCAGMALGLDRLIMLLTDTPKIQDVVTFT